MEITIVCSYSMGYIDFNVCVALSADRTPLRWGGGRVLAVS